MPQSFHATIRYSWFFWNSHLFFCQGFELFSDSLQSVGNCWAESHGVRRGAVVHCRKPSCSTTAPARKAKPFSLIPSQIFSRMGGVELFCCNVLRLQAIHMLWNEIFKKKKSIANEEKRREWCLSAFRVGDEVKKVARHNGWSKFFFTFFSEIFFKKSTAKEHNRLIKRFRKLW